MKRLQTGLGFRLKQHQSLRELEEHLFFINTREGIFDRDAVEIILGQWWHPLHQFPDFLAHTICVVDRSEQTSVARILDQELGEGHPERAHEQIYLQTMAAVGFDPHRVAHSAPSAATAALVSGYRQAGGSRCTALGCLYATEMADLTMVAGIGRAIRRATGATSLPWVDIHAQQEPNHVGCVADALQYAQSSGEAAAVEAAAMHMWQLWQGFFSTLNDSLADTSRRLALH